jgi:hypothetical protein
MWPDVLSSMIINSLKSLYAKMLALLVVVG